MSSANRRPSPPREEGLRQLPRSSSSHPHLLPLLLQLQLQLLLPLLGSVGFAGAVTATMRAATHHPLIASPADVRSGRSWSSSGRTALPSNVKKVSLVTRATVAVEQEKKAKVALLKIGTRGRYDFERSLSSLSLLILSEAANALIVRYVYLWLKFWVSLVYMYGEMALGAL